MWGSGNVKVQPGCMKTDSCDIGSYVTTYTSPSEDFLVSELKWSPDTQGKGWGGEDLHVKPPQIAKKRR